MIAGIASRWSATWRALATPTGLVLVANVLLGAAGAIATVAVTRAARLDPLPVAAPIAPPPQALAGPAHTADARGDGDEPGAAPELDSDPFHAERELPELVEPDGEAIAAAEAPPAIAPESVRLLGTVVLSGARSFAIYQLPSEVPRTLRIGERVGGLRLETVAPGSAVFRGSDGSRVEMHLTRLGN